MKQAVMNLNLGRVPRGEKNLHRTLKNAAPCYVLSSQQFFHSLIPNCLESGTPEKTTGSKIKLQISVAQSRTTYSAHRKALLHANHQT